MNSLVVSDKVTTDYKKRVGGNHEPPLGSTLYIGQTHQWPLV